MALVLRRVAAAAVLVLGLALSWVVFLIGAPALAGAPLREPVEMACVDPWVDAHPGDFEPGVEGEWSWWPPGLTCRHVSGEVYVEPTASDAVGVAAVGVIVLLVGVVPTVVLARGLWGARSSEVTPRPDRSPVSSG